MVSSNFSFRLLEESLVILTKQLVSTSNLKKHNNLIHKYNLYYHHQLTMQLKSIHICHN